MTSELTNIALAWLLTYAIHSTLLLGLAFLISRRAATSAFTRDLLWKVAMVGGVLTSLAQNQLGTHAISSFALSPATTLAPAPAGPGRKAGEAAATAVGESRAAGVVAIDASPATPVDFRASALRNARDSRVSTRDASPSPVTPAIAIDWARAIVLGWASLAALLALTHFGRRLVLMGRLANRRPIVEGPLPAMLDALCRNVGFQSHVRLTSVNTIASPVALGLHEICVPDAVLTELEPEQQRSLLAHELAHLARRDPVWLIVATLLERVFFFQPLNRIARQALQRNAEFLCDDWAASQAGSGLPLAHCLERVAEWMEASPLGVPVAGMAEQRSLLVSRIARLIEGRRAAKATSQLALSGGAALVLVFTTAAAPGVRRDSLATPSAATQSGVQQALLRTGDSAEQNATDDTLDLTSHTLGSGGELARVLNRGRRISTSGLAEVASHTSLPASHALDSPQWATASLARLAGTSRSPAEVEDPAVIAALIERLKDTDAGVRRAAASSLGRLKSRTAVPALIGAMGDRNREVRGAIVEALANIEDVSAVPALQRALTDESADVRKSALDGLSNFSDNLRPEALLPALKDASPEVRARAADILGEIGDRAAVSDLAALLRDGHSNVRQQALHALGKLRERSVTASIVPLLRDNNADVRNAALQALGELKYIMQESDLLALLGDPDADVRSQALQYVRENPSASLVPVLRRLLEDPNADVREHAVDALSEIRDPAARAALKAALSSEDKNVRRGAAEALGERP